MCSIGDCFQGDETRGGKKSEENECTTTIPFLFLSSIKVNKINPFLGFEMNSHQNQPESSLHKNYVGNLAKTDIDTKFPKCKERY